MKERDKKCLCLVCSKSCRPAPLETAVSKSPDRGVIWRAGVERRRPLRVLGPMLATSYDDGLPVALSVANSRATQPTRPSSATEAGFRPKLSAVSLSRAVRVIECCLPSIGRNPCTFDPRSSGRCRHPCPHDRPVAICRNQPLPRWAVGILKTKMAKWSLWHPGWGVREPGVSNGTIGGTSTLQPRHAAFTSTLGVSCRR